jgi:hypothetical protein
MATTNAAISQTNNALKRLNTAATAQANANAGINVSRNVATANTSYNAAAAGFRGVARKMNALNLKGVAANFNSAANAAEAAGAAKSAKSAKNGLNKLRNAMLSNMNKLRNNQVPTNSAGIV